MKLILEKIENIALTIITILPILSPLYLLLLVRLGGNLSDFYYDFFKINGKLTVFWQL
jgi:hypothetical protein